MKAYAKAIVGGALAALAFAIPVVDDGISLADALGIVLAALAGFQGVYWTTNKPKET